MTEFSPLLQLDGRKLWSSRTIEMILVVGATGLLGSEICLKLAERGEKVRGLIRLTSSSEKVESTPPSARRISRFANSLHVGHNHAGAGMQQR